MSTNPYEVTKANLEPAEPEVSVPPEIARKIRNGWVAGAVSVAFTLVFVVISLVGTPIMGIDAWGSIDAALMAGLSYGVFRKSRTCAIVLLLFFALNKVLMWVEMGTVTGLPLALVFFWFFYQGVVGTFQFHEWKRDLGARG